MKQVSAQPKPEDLTGSSKAGVKNRPSSDGQPNRSHAKLALDLRAKIDVPDHVRRSLEESELKRIKELPKEVGVMLITAGIVGFILPGPGTPAIIAGGLALWPDAFGKLESWLERRHPEIHRQSMKQIGRFLTDLEKRYPYGGHD